MKENRSLLEIRKKLSTQLLEAHELRPPQGSPTGLQQLDEFLLWQGLPLGHLCLFQGEVGTGRTSLWLQSAAQILARGGWCCWISTQHRLRPPTNNYKNSDLSRLLVLHPPPESKKVLFALREACSSQLFDLIGVEIDPCTFSKSDGARLQKLVRQNQLPLVLISRYQPLPSDLLSLILNFDSPHLIVQRALHRPTPYLIKRSHYENPVPEIFSERTERISS